MRELSPRSIITSQSDPGDGDERVQNDASHPPSSEFLTSPVGPIDHLPSELINLVDRFVDSLNVRVHSLPPNIEQVSTLFQDFYVRASSRIVSLLAAPIPRRTRQFTSSQSSRSSSLNKDSIPGQSRVDSGEYGGGAPEQQMLSGAELARQREARRRQARLQASLEEGVERRACQMTYEKLWRHRSTQDEERDDKLRSRTAALSMVGVGLKDLGIVWPSTSDQRDVRSLEAGDNEVYLKLVHAREGLEMLDEAHYPFEKLHCLRLVIKTIVDTLSSLTNCSASADDILPVMIFTLITGLSEGMHVISNLYFIQRFRDHRKLDGEAAYSLTTLEAAVTFLETVDLQSLKGEEPSSYKQRSTEQTPTSFLDQEDPESVSSASGVHPPTMNSMGKDQSSTLTIAHQRRPSRLLQGAGDAFGAASDVVRGSTDQGLRTFSTALDHSFRFFTGKLQERQTNTLASPDLKNGSFIPKTLDEARLMMTAPEESELNETGSLTAEYGVGFIGNQASVKKQQSADRYLNLFGGRLPSRDVSVDSITTSSNSKWATLNSGLADENQAIQVSSRGSSPCSDQTTPVLVPSNDKSNLAPGFAFESVRNLSSALNPLSRLSGISFGRTSGKSNPEPDGARERVSMIDRASDANLGPTAGLIDTFPELASQLSPKQQRTTATNSELEKINVPNDRFLAIENPGDLKISEVLELLRDYRRLANALKERQAFKKE